jgi:NADP-dependent 3-hydroxy acid dehydrogenase YdfG
MKILITGHTKGIGNAVYNRLLKAGHNVVGFSRSNNNDISDTKTIIKKIIKEDPDVLINNAYHKNSQTEILKSVYRAWKEKNKTIINMCSVAALIPSSHSDYNSEYATDKRNQKIFCDKINFSYSKKDFLDVRCKLTNLNFDYTKTSFKSKYDKRKFPNLSPDDIADIIIFILSNKTICFRDISFHSTRAPEVF